jgi:cyclic-di-GMP phosphodiesterase, flagellum assembly factor TipF
MTDDQSSVPPPRRARDITRDGIVMLSMTFVGLAVGFGLHLQMGLAFWSAAAAAAVVYLAMLFSHLILSQSRETALLRREVVRLNVELTQLRRTPAEGGILREAPGSAGAASAAGHGAPYGYGRGYQSEVTVPLASVAGPDPLERSRPSASGPVQLAGQADLRPRAGGLREEAARVRSAPVIPPVAPDKRPAPKLRPNIDDAADLLSDLGGLADPAQLPTPVKQSAVKPSPVAPPLAQTASPVAAQSATPIAPVPMAAVQAAPAQPPAPAAAPTMKPVAASVPIPSLSLPPSRVAMSQDVRPVAVKKAVTTEGDRDVEAIHDLIKKLAADIVGGHAASPAAAAPMRAAPAATERTKSVQSEAVKPASTGRVPPAVPVQPAIVLADVLPKPVVKPTDLAVDPAQALTQSLADQLDTLPPVRNQDRPVAAAPVVSPVSAAAVAAARSAVEARLAAAKAVPSAPALPEASVNPALPPVPQPPAGSAGDAESLAGIGAQLAADLGAESASDESPAPDGPAFDSNLQALKSAVDAMRAQPTVAALAAALETSAQVPAAVALADPQLQEKLGLISSALDEERFDVCLEAIIGLEDRRAQHYEVTVRLKDVDDDARETARGSGLLPLLDAVTVDQSARIAWKLEDRGKPGSLFSQINGESLESDRFLNRFADTYRHSETVASRLVLAFVQSDLRVFSAAHWATLRDMADLGFRFSLEDLTDLDLDFEALKQAGFGFVRLDAPVFLKGLPLASGSVSASDICRYFDALGLQVIVGRIADEEQYGQLIDSGVGLGQGMLFGEARPVKADVLKSQQRAVA